LSTPETVPFRLTRDMVDGLGITGVDGLFKNCCEDTLRCLRRPDNAAALATLAEVTLVHTRKCCVVKYAACTVISILIFKAILISEYNN
jgi:hypothetical protein